jgi:hypothetical protein
MDNEWFSSFSKIELWRKVLYYNSHLAERNVAIIDSNHNIITNNVVDYFGYDIFADSMKREIANSEPHTENINNLKLYRIIASIDSLRKVNTIYHLFQCKNLVLTENIQEKVDNFKGFVKGLFNQDRIIQELVNSNYINENFYAYASVFMKGSLFSFPTHD